MNMTLREQFDQITGSEIFTFDPAEGRPGANEIDWSWDCTPRTAGGRVPLKDRLLSVSQLSALKPTTALIEGLIYEDTLVQLAGKPGCYKSFATVGMACSLALGVPFGASRKAKGEKASAFGVVGGPAGESAGFAAPAARNVVYVAAEGATGLQVRIKAWCQLRGHDITELDGKLWILPCPVQLDGESEGGRLDITEACELVREVGAGLLILDTRARCTVGLDENSATEQGRAIDEAEKIRMAAGCTVLAVHHTSRAGEAGRGSNAWDGAVWSDLHIKGVDQAATVTCAKHKDVQAGCSHEFTLANVTVPEGLMPGVEEQHRQTLVMVSSAESERAGDVGMPASVRSVLELIRSCPDDTGFTRPELAKTAEDEHNVKRTQCYEAINKLVRDGLVQIVGTEKTPRFVAVKVGKVQTKLEQRGEE